MYVEQNVCVRNLRSALQCAAVCYSACAHALEFCNIDSVYRLATQSLRGSRGILRYNKLQHNETHCNTASVDRKGVSFPQLRDWKEQTRNHMPHFWGKIEGFGHDNKDGENHVHKNPTNMGLFSRLSYKQFLALLFTRAFALDVVYTEEFLYVYIYVRTNMCRDEYVCVYISPHEYVCVCLCTSS